MHKWQAIGATLLTLACRGPGGPDRKADTSATPPTTAGLSPDTAGPSGTEPLRVHQVRWEAIERPGLFGAFRLVVEADREVQVLLRVLSPAWREVDLGRGPAVQDHLLAGFSPDTVHEAEVEVRAGADRQPIPVRFTTPPIGPFDFQLEVKAFDPARSSPGWTLFAPTRPDGADWLVMADHAGRVVWAWQPPKDWKAMTLTPQGTLVGVQEQAFVEINWAGEVLYGVSAVGGDGLPRSTFGDPHHEALPLPDLTRWTLVSEVREVPWVPLDYDRTTWGPSELSTSVAVHLDRTLLPLQRVDLFPFLDPTRLGWDSLDPAAAGGTDHSHANGLFWRGDDASLLVSLRNQDAVFKIDPARGELRWILANPDGWDEAHQALRLTPTHPDLIWPGHPHAPHWQDGSLLLFDNGNNGRTTPYSQDNRTDTFSRVVSYRIDEGARTVTESWAFLPPERLFSPILGNADPLPGGTVLGTWGSLQAEGGVDNLTRGRGLRSARILEFDPSDQAVVSDWNLWGEAEVAPEGWQIDRALRVEQLYGEGTHDSTPGLAPTPAGG